MVELDHFHDYEGDQLTVTVIMVVPKFFSLWKDKNENFHFQETFLVHKDLAKSGELNDLVIALKLEGLIHT